MEVGLSLIEGKERAGFTHDSCGLLLILTPPLVDTDVIYPPPWGILESCILCVRLDHPSPKEKSTLDHWTSAPWILP